ncbi:asialoglycoprotein receptor 1-like [Hyperolius riggenbachi]|uniref:asialoglycoprotein receptor 1-like n=1 Tax=Hyperolius riggenbachi TaxID=752182 RepID=UPI0035A2D4AD
MSSDNQDLQYLHKVQEAEEDKSYVKMDLWFVQPSPRILCAMCGVCAALLSIIVILIISFRYPGEKPPDRSFEFQIGNLSERMNSALAQMSQDGAKMSEKLRQMDDTLKAMQADTSISAVQSKVDRVLTTLSRLSERVKKLQVNGSEDFTCKPGWKAFQLSCYFYSSAGKSWTESKRTCETMNSHLVVINSEEEQDFLFVLTKGKYTWIGLTDVSGTWKWVDGTSEDSAIKNWRPNQPDEFYGHGLGGGEDCAHMHDDGRWNDDHCSRGYSYLCEVET